MNVGYILLLRLSGVQENDKGRKRQRRQQELVRWHPRGPVQRQSTVRRRKRICTLAAKRAGAVRLKSVTTGAAGAEVQGAQRGRSADGAEGQRRRGTEAKRAQRAQRRSGAEGGFKV